MRRRKAWRKYVKAAYCAEAAGRTGPGGRTGDRYGEGATFPRNQNAGRMCAGKKPANIRKNHPVRIQALSLQNSSPLSVRLWRLCGCTYICMCARRWVCEYIRLFTHHGRMYLYPYFVLFRSSFACSSFNTTKVLYRSLHAYSWTAF